ncbi:MAG TPA: HAD-IIIA family hydrolase [Polyangia bacterium]|jgi:D-glycero-D-manno-heptose 1,7-bisphosphate phosphatase|nr:HAD-IIIA family hydrolase [Polyangia bacterium]
MDARAVLIVLDRDGVLNRTIPNPAEPRPDSPLRVEEVALYPWVPATLRALTDAGFGLVIASNQPAAAKGKVSRAALEAVHRVVLDEAQRAGGVILSSHVCFHRAEDGCDCRKPRTGLLREAFARHPGFTPAASWMVGDRAVDVQAGAAFGLQTALLAGDALADERRALAPRAIQPSFCGRDLRDFAELLLEKKPLLSPL